ncbi:MAG: hypothetical protein ACOC56_05860 [Atribacterota bacterium]
MFKKVLKKVRKKFYNIFDIRENSVRLEKYKNNHRKFVERYAETKAKNEQREKELKEVKDNISKLEEVARLAGMKSDEDTVTRAIVGIKAEQVKEQMLEKAVSETGELLNRLHKNISAGFSNIAIAESVSECNILRKDLAELHRQVGDNLKSSKAELNIDVNETEIEARAAEIENEIIFDKGDSYNLLQEFQQSERTKEIEKEVKKYMK